MEITFQSIGVALAAVAIVAAAVERGVELFRPLWNKIKNTDIQNTAKIGAALLLGFFVASVTKIDFFAMLGLSGLAPLAGYVAVAVLASAGASPWHALLEWLKTLRYEKETFICTEDQQ